MARKKRLTRLKINEVSVCDAAANPYAQILLRKAADSGAAVSFRKSDTGQVWTLPADIDCLPALIAAAPGWGIEILTDSASPPAADVVEGPLVKRGGPELPASPAPIQEVRKMRSREAVEIIKRAASAGEAIPFSRDDVYALMQKRADREIEGPTAAIRFARYANTENGRACMQAMKVAEPGPAAAPPRNAYEADIADRERIRKQVRADQADRERAIEHAITATMRAFRMQFPSMTEAEARRRTMALGHIQAMRRGGPVPLHPLAGVGAPPITRA